MKGRPLLALTFIVLSPLAMQGGSAALNATLVAGAGEDTITVYPTGVHPADVANVQLAVDTVDPGGTVILKSTDVAGNPMAFNFGGTAIGNGGVVRLLRPGITLTGDGWDGALDEPRTRIVGGGAPHSFSATCNGAAVVLAVQAPGVTIRLLKVDTAFAYTAVFISSALQQASDAAVVVENSHLSAVNLGVNLVYSAAFPVVVRNNVLRGAWTVAGQWLGFTLVSISDFPYDLPVAPTDAQGTTVHYPVEITNNTIVRTTGSLMTAVTMFGWANLYSQNPDPEVGVRRYRQSASSPYVYQHVQGDNGPLMISGNTILVDSPDTYSTVVAFGGGYRGLSRTLFKGNRIAGPSGAVVIERFAYGHDVRIEDNDLSAAEAYQQLSVDGADTIVAGNIFGPIIPLPVDVAMPAGLPQSAVALISVNYNPGVTPVPNPIERCALVKNDYRVTGLESASILVASQEELQWPFYTTGVGTGGEVMHNLIFESGGFPPGTGQAGDQILMVAGIVNPATGLPYVHDNRVIGLPARVIAHPGIGPIVSSILPSRKMQHEGLHWQ